MKPLLGIAIEGGEALTLDHDVTPATDVANGLTIDNVLIEGDRWGSSGYYPASVLESDGAKAFPAGTQIFLDHTELGKTDSAAKLIGELQEDARYVVEDDGKKVLRAPMRFYESGVYNATWVKERVKRLGISIRSGVKFSPYTDDKGRSGKRVTAFTEGISVDVVARAGAGGKFGTIKESAGPLLAQEEEERQEMTPEEIKAMATAIAESLKPSFDALDTSLKAVGDKVAESGKPTLTAAQVAEKLKDAKISKAAVTRVWEAFESKGNVEDVIARETAEWAEALEEAKKGEGNFVHEDGNGAGNGDGKAEESMVDGWGVVEVSK